MSLLGDAERHTVPAAKASHVANYDVAPHGQRFVMVKEDPPAPVEKQLRVVPNWFKELKRQVPVRPAITTR